MFVDGLLNSDPPIINPDHLRPFISEVFGNIHAISSHHHRMLAALFSRQREQHPLVQSVADIILDSQSDSPFYYSPRLKFVNQLPFSSVPIMKLTSRVTLSLKPVIGPNLRRTRSTANGYNSVPRTLEYGSGTSLLSFRGPLLVSHDYACCSRQSLNSRTRIILTRNRCRCSSAY